MFTTPLALQYHARCVVVERSPIKHDLFSRPNRAEVRRRIRRDGADEERFERASRRRARGRAVNATRTPVILIRIP